MGYDESCSSSLSSSTAPQESKVQPLPGGFHFEPEDGELIEFYLLPRCLGGRVPVDIIPDIQDPYQHPSTLERPFEYALDNESYFFTKFQQKSDIDARKIRSIEKLGYWKTTSEPRPVQHEKKTVGHKKRFTFYEVDDDKRHKKTDWIMHEYTVDVSTLDGKRMLEECVLCKLYNNKKSSSYSPDVRSDPPCPSSPDITSSREQRQDEFYNDNGDSFVSQSNNVDTPNVILEAATIPDVLMINNDNQVPHPAQLSGANLSSAPYFSTQDTSSLGLLQKEAKNWHGAAYTVLPQFSRGMPSPYAPQMMEVDQTMMNVDLVQNPFQLSDAELSSATDSSSQNMASLEMHPAIPYCNQAIPSTNQWDSLDMMEVDGRILSNEGQLVQFLMMQLENTPQGNTPLHTFTRQEALDGSKSIMNEGHPQQRKPQQQEHMSFAYLSHLNDYLEQDGFQSWQHSVSEDYPHQWEDIFAAYTPQEPLQTFQVEFSNEDYRQSCALWHEEGIQPEHHLMNNSQQQHAPQHDQDDERLALQDI